MSAARTHRLYHRLQVAAHRLQKSADRALASEGVTTAQAAVLAVVAGAQGATQRDVARLLGLNESAVTAMTSRLLDAGFVTREKDKSDPRAKRLRLTAAGEDVRRRVAQRFRSINQRLDAIIAADDMAHLADLLTRIGHACDDPEEDTP